MSACIAVASPAITLFQKREVSGKRFGDELEKHHVQCENNATEL